MYASTVMIKPASADCNLHCSYCFYHRPGNPYRHAAVRRMDFATLETVVRRQFKAAAGNPLSFMFQGGEPLLAGHDFFAHFGWLVRKVRSPGQLVTLTVQTNGTLIDSELADIFKDNNFLVGVSLDGPASLHDVYRRDLVGHGTHHRVIRGIQTLQAHGVQLNILTVVHAANVGYAREVYQYLKDEIGARYLQFIPCVELRDGQPIPESVTPEEYAQFLVSLFAAWSHDGYGTVSVRLFDSITNALYNGLPGSCVLEVACARSLVVEYNGDVYPCDFYVTEEQLLGNVHTHTCQELMVAPARVRLEREKGQLPEACVRCSYVALCHGGCPKYRRINAYLGGDGVFYFCSAYKALFERLVPVVSEFVAKVMWNEATPLERTILFGLAQLGQYGVESSGVTLPAVQNWLTAYGQDTNANQVEETLNALVARRVLVRLVATRYAFRTDLLPSWIRRTCGAAGLTL